MKNRINLTNYNTRTDLIIDYPIQNKKEEKISKNISITTININQKLEKVLNKKTGTYTTIEFQDTTNHEDKIEIENTLTIQIKKYLKKLNIKENDNGLIIGLGNRACTPDSLGPKTIDKILVTRHLFELNTNVKKGIRNISAITPGVMANTGIESYDIIKSITEKTKPKFLIIIDALASSSINRINKTIQITDTGINPGSGVGNHRKELSINTLNIPIIAIGVPTVVETSIIVNDTINYLIKHLSYLKTHYDQNKLIIKRNKNYINILQNQTPTNEEKQQITGAIGQLTEQDKISLIQEVLKNIDKNMIVTPKEIDFLTENLSEIISNSINKSLHKAID